MSQEDYVPALTARAKGVKRPDGQHRRKRSRRNEEEDVTEVEDSVKAPKNALPPPTERREILKELSLRSSGLECRFPGKFFE